MKKKLLKCGNPACMTALKRPCPVVFYWLTAVILKLRRRLSFQERTLFKLLNWFSSIFKHLTTKMDDETVRKKHSSSIIVIQVLKMLFLFMAHGKNKWGILGLPLNYLLYEGNQLISEIWNQCKHNYLNFIITCIWNV